MFYDAMRRTVREVFKGCDILEAKAAAASARCPECEAELVARRPTARIWHWAHKTTSNCRHTAGESEFHIRTKLGLLAAGFDLETPFEQWRFDATSATHHFAVVEVVNSLSDTYFAKAQSLAPLGSSQLWILNSKAAWTSSIWEAERRQGWQDLVDALKRVGATIWWIDNTIYEEPGCVDVYDHPGLLAHLYHAHDDDIPLETIEANLAATIQKARPTSLTTMQEAAHGMMAEARDLTRELRKPSAISLPLHARANLRETAAQRTNHLLDKAKVARMIQDSADTGIIMQDEATRLIADLRDCRELMADQIVDDLTSRH